MTTPSSERERLPGMPELIKIIGTESPEFTAWRNAQPDKYWKNWELSAIRVGYELGTHTIRTQTARIAELEATVNRLTAQVEWLLLAQYAR